MSDLTDSNGVKRDVGRHEAQLDELNVKVQSIQLSLTRIETRLSATFEGPQSLCQRHLDAIKTMEEEIRRFEKELEKMKIRIASWGGGIGLACTLLILFAPIIRASLHLP